MAQETDDGTGHTYVTRFRIPRRMWAAFGRVAERRGTDRTSLLLGYIRADIKAHGNEQDLADLAAAEAELDLRRSRRGGRPPRK